MQRHLTGRWLKRIKDTHGFRTCRPSKETTTTAGTGAVTLLGASTGYQSFAVIGNANTTYYTIASQSGQSGKLGSVHITPRVQRLPEPRCCQTVQLHSHRRLVLVRVQKMSLYPTLLSIQ
jgi:hypothetical protein